MKYLATILIFVFTSCFDLTKPPDSINVNIPITDATKKANEKDSSYLFLDLDTNNFKVLFSKKELKTKKMSSIDSFIKANVNGIDSTKIIIKMNEGFRQDKFSVKYLKEILKKNNINKFRIVTD